MFGGSCRESDFRGFSWDCLGWDGMLCDAIRCDRMQQDAMGCDGMAHEKDLEDPGQRVNTNSCWHLEVGGRLMGTCRKECL